MKNLKRMLALLMAMAMLLLASGIAEEQEGTELELLPAENLDVPVDEPLPAEGEAAPVPETLTLDQTSATLDYSQSVVLTAVASEGAESITWTSSDENVATISAKTGESVTVVGINEGAAIITCTLGEQTQNCEVTVNAPQTLQITGVDYPSTFNISGRGWKLRNGTIASTVDLATITSMIKNANGEEVGSAYTRTFDGNVRRFEIRDIDNFVPFSRITAAGAFTWTLSATDVGGRTVSMNLPINAVNGAETVVAVEEGSYFTGETMESVDTTSGDKQATGVNLLVGTGMPVSQAFNTPTAANGRNFAVFDPYHTYGKQTLKALGFAAGDKVTISFDWSISKNGDLGLLCGNFRAEWVGWKDDADGQYIEGIQNPIGTFAVDHTSDRARFTVTLSEAALQAHTIRIRVDVSALTLTLSHMKLERGEVENPVWTPAIEDIKDIPGEEDVDSQNLLADANLPVSRAFNTPSVPEERNFEVFDPYHTPGKQTLQALGFVAGDIVTISFDWSISKNGDLDPLYGNFRAEWIGWKDGADGRYIGVIQNPVDTFGVDHMQGHAQFTTTLSEETLQAHTIRIRVDNSVLTLTISNAKLLRGEVESQD